MFRQSKIWHCGWCYKLQTVQYLLIRWEVEEGWDNPACIWSEVSYNWCWLIEVTPVVLRKALIETGNVVLKKATQYWSLWSFGHREQFQVGFADFTAFSNIATVFQATCEENTCDRMDKASVLHVSLEELTCPIVVVSLNWWCQCPLSHTVDITHWSGSWCEWSQGSQRFIVACVQLPLAPAGFRQIALPTISTETWRCWWRRPMFHWRHKECAVD